MKKLAVLVLSLALLGLLTVPAVAQDQSIGWTAGSSNINSAINVNIVNENTAATGNATAVGNEAGTMIGNTSIAGAALGSAVNTTSNGVGNSGVAVAGSGDAGAGQGAVNGVGVSSGNGASVVAVIPVIIWP